MDIITRNLICEIRKTAFDERDAVTEPMSPFKWRKLCHIGCLQGIGYIVKDNCKEAGVKCDDAHDNSDKYEFTKFKTGVMALRLNTPFTSKALMTVIEDEMHAIDTNVETLTLLWIMIDTLNDMLQRGLTVRGVVNMGRYLRQYGDHIDFNKLDKWLGKIYLRRTAQLQGSILVTLFGFEKDELPFVRRIEPTAKKLAIKSLTDSLNDPVGEWHFKISSTGFVKNNGSAFKRNLQRSLRLMPYTPIEATGNIITNFVRSLAEIEE